MKPKPTIVLPDFASEMVEMQTRIEELAEEVVRLKALVREMGNVVDYMSRQWENDSIPFAWVQVSEEIIRRTEVRKIIEETP